MTHTALTLPLLLATSIAGNAPQDPDPFERFELENGVRLAVMHVPDAPRQTTFTFLPHGLVADPAGRAQFAHLAEHMLIRSTDPDSLSVPGIDINGETSALALRMETYAEPGAWRESIRRHARWLDARAFDADVLEREKERIAGEERTTTAGGFTHKWAEAAWGQIVRGGRDHAAVHGDVAGATVEDVAAWVEARIGLGLGVLIASVGPVDANELRDALDAELAEVVRATEASSHTSREEDRTSPEEGDRTATWDLDAHHYLEWYRLPDDAVDRIGGSVFAQLVSVALSQDSSGPFRPGQAMARVIAAPEGSFLMISASLPDGSALDSARAAFGRAIESAKKGAGMSMAMALFQLKAQAGSVPDVAAARKQMENHGHDTSLIEAQLALNLLIPEIQLGLERGELIAGYKALDEDRMKALVGGSLRAEARASLFLTPRR